MAYSLGPAPNLSLRAWARVSCSFSPTVNFAMTLPSVPTNFTMYFQ